MTKGPPSSGLFSPTRAWKLVKRTVFPAPHRMRVQRPDPASWAPDRLTVACLGHATTLFNIRGTTMLTDPALVERVGIGNIAGVTVGLKRLLPPALTIDELPRLDAVLLSHAHADHMDLGTLESLPRHTPVVVPTRTADVIAGCGFRDLREIAWNETIEIGGARITSVQVTHFGRRNPWDQRRGRGYCGYLVTKDGASVFFGGDTAHTTFPPTVAPNGVDVAILGIGGYNPFVWNHATPEQAWDMARQLRARFFLPMHWGVFMLSDEPIEEPLWRLLAAAAKEDWRIVGRTIGETFVVPVSHDDDAP